MLILNSTTDSLRVINNNAGSLDVVCSWMEHSNANPPVPAPADTTATAITGAATTTVVAAPASGVRRNVKTVHIRNKHASVSQDVEVVFTRSATDYSLHKVTLNPGESLEYIEGIGWFELSNPTTSTAQPPAGSTNYSTASSAAGFASDTYVSGSNLNLGAFGGPYIGIRYNFRLVISKTAAGTATPILIVRVGTAGTTADTARLTFTWGPGTAAVDRGEIELECMFATVGSGTAAVLRGKANWSTNLQTTGLTSTIKALQVNSSGFDSTVANSIIGLSYNGGTSAVHTIEWASAWIDRL